LDFRTAVKDKKPLCPGNGSSDHHILRNSIGQLHDSSSFIRINAPALTGRHKGLPGSIKPFHNEIMNGQIRSQIQPGMKVRVVEKLNQRSGKLTEGIVQRILTNSPQHPRGIKVMLDNGIVGRVKEIVQSP
jgi:uncharacterized repeat protein (TIGR03833 family)